MSKPVILDWLPDWRNESEYPDSERACRLDWGWAFLRRNPGYQKDWNYLQALNQLLGTYGLPSDLYDVTGKLKPVNEAPGPVMKRWIKESSLFNHKSSEAFMAEAYGMQGEPKDPSESTINRAFRLNKKRVTLHMGTLHKGGTLHPELLRNHVFDLSRSEGVAIFDFSLPINPQLKIIKEELQYQKRKYMEEGGEYQASRVWAQNYPVYLRILDAKTRRVTHLTIASVLYPNMSNDHPDYLASRKIKDHFKEARRLRDHGYRDLFQLPPSSQ